jgi:protein-disulfide isomerase
VRRNLPLLIIAVVLLFAIGGGWFLYRARMAPEPAPTPTPAASSPTPAASATAAALPAETSTPVVTTTPEVTPPQVETATPAPSAPSPQGAGPVITYGKPGAEPMHVRGDASAPVVLEEFGDFECLPCSKLFPALQALEKEFGERLVVVFRQHPLTMHRYGLDAARAAEAAGLQGKFWEMHDTLYQNRATWVRAAYVRPYLNEYATALQLDVDRFKEDMDAKQVADRIVADQARGDSLGIDRTPVVFVNGEKVAVQDLNENGLRAMIEKALAAKAH